MEFSLFMPQLAGTIKGYFCLPLLIAKLGAPINKPWRSDLGAVMGLFS